MLQALQEQKLLQKNLNNQNYCGANINSHLVAPKQIISSFRMFPASFKCVLLKQNYFSFVYVYCVLNTLINIHLWSRLATTLLWLHPFGKGVIVFVFIVSHRFSSFLIVTYSFSPLLIVFLYFLLSHLFTSDIKDHLIQGVGRQAQKTHTKG